MKKNRKINCMKCKYFYITWDRNNPNGCRAIGFKTKQIPSVAVMRNTGTPCQFYKKKDK